MLRTRNFASGFHGHLITRTHINQLATFTALAPHLAAYRPSAHQAPWVGCYIEVLSPRALL